MSNTTTIDGKHCPKCARDIGVWPIVKAGLPNLLRCPHCAARIRYENAGIVVAVLLVLVVVFTYLAYAVAGALTAAGSPMRNWLFIALLVAVWVPIELATARFLRRTRRLRAVDSQP